MNAYDAKGKLFLCLWCVFSSQLGDTNVTANEDRPWRPILARECSSNARERLAVSFTIIYYTNAHLPHAREFSAYARECITRKLSVASWPEQGSTCKSGNILDPGHIRITQRSSFEMNHNGQQETQRGSSRSGNIFTLTPFFFCSLGRSESFTHTHFPF